MASAQLAACLSERIQASWPQCLFGRTACLTGGPDRPGWRHAMRQPCEAKHRRSRRRLALRLDYSTCLLPATCSPIALAFIVVGEAAPVAQTPVTYPDPTVRVLTHREQNELVTPWIKKRFDTVLPGLMTREGIDMWIIPTREYNEDPVFASMSPLTYFASRRRTILVFYNPGGGKPVERYSIGRFDYDKLYTMYPTSNDGQHEGLRKLVEEKQPKVIGINESEAWNHADGITANEKRRLMEALGPTLRRAREVGRDAGGGLARGEAARGARGLPPRDEGRAHGHPRGVLEQGDHARQDHHRRTWCGGCASAWRSWASARGSSRRSPSGARAATSPPCRASSSPATCSTPTSASSTWASPPTRSTTPTCCCPARPTRRRD